MMINEKVNISVDYAAMGVQPSPRQTILTTYILDSRNIQTSMKKKRPAVIVCPGGAYEFTSEREAEPIAMKYNAAGFHAFVLDYSVAPSSYPAALCELSKAVKYVKDIAEENNIDRDRIFVAGFSAGGHLVASLGVHHSRPEVLKFADVVEGENIPAGLILGYPVITGDETKAHMGSVNNFVGKNEAIRPLASLENYVTEKTPQCFIWHTFSDAAVPVANSLRFANALEKSGVKFELHIYPNGEHGLSLADETTATHEGGCVSAPQNWIDMSIRWMNEFEQ